MSSDGFFNDDFDDSALIAEVDAVSAAYLAPATTPAPAPVRAPAPAPARARAPPPVSKFKPATTRPSRIPSPAAPPVVIEIPDSDDYDVSGMFDEADLLELDAAASTAYSRTASTSSAAPPVRSVVRTTSKSNVQLDLFGNPVNAAASSSRTVTTPGRPANGGASARQGNSFGGPQRKTKHWDHTAFAKSGWKFTKSKGKGKSRDADEEEDDEEEESRQLPAPFVPGECSSHLMHT
jgi:ATP-dependent DNA helicase MPH1